MNKTFIFQKEIKDIFDEFIKENKIAQKEEKEFNNFLKFLKIDLYDWTKENLRCYFLRK